MLPHSNRNTRQPGNRWKIIKCLIGFAMPSLASLFIGAYILFRPLAVNGIHAQMYQKDSKEYKHHIETYGAQDTFGYKNFIPMFKAEKFNADKWVALFKKAGAKYVVPVAEHHDGFAMYNTALSKWNAVNMGPHRDVVGEIAEAVKKQGLILGVSSHRIEHWWFMNGGRAFNSDVNDSAYADFYGPATVEDAMGYNRQKATHFY